MKTLTKTKLLFITFIVLLVSCNNNPDNIQQEEEMILPKSEIEKATLQQKIDYANYHLLEIGKTISKLSKNKSFTDNLFNSINKKANETGQSEIQIRELLKSIKSNNKIDLTNKDIEKIENEFKAFYDLDGEDWHPAIYVSNFKEKYQKLSSRTNNYDDTKPLIVPVVYENDDEFVEDRYKVYQENDNGDLEELDFDITESESANYDNLYFVKLSEVAYNDPDASSSTSNTSNTEPNLFLKRMKGKYHKESTGNSEIEIRGYLEYISNYYPVTTNYIASTYKQFSYKRRWIRRKDWKTKNFNLTVSSSNGIAPQNRTIYSYVIYEWDGWPAPWKTKTISYTFNNGQTYSKTISYRSWQSPYDKGAVDSFQNQNLWYFNNSSISYEFEKKYTY